MTVLLLPAGPTGLFSFASLTATATIEDATFLQGCDTVETESGIRRRCGDAFKVSAIGPAGENLVRFASVMSDGPAARAAGRCGLGAVMGSKNLKAIAVAGNTPVELAHAEKLIRSLREFLPPDGENSRALCGKSRKGF